jgi:hypothetical protein
MSQFIGRFQQTLKIFGKDVWIHIQINR